MTKSPLRYPGGKSRAITTILKQIPINTKEVCSPFIGGGSIELALISNNIRVYAYDNFQLLIEFWQCLLKDPNELANRITSYYPLNKQMFRILQERHNTYRNIYERAAIFYVLNRASYSGTILNGGMSINHPRFTKSKIEELRTFKTTPLLTVDHKSFEESIILHPDILLYLDPPYLISENLYGKVKQDKLDHLKLYNILKTRNNWILSYNNCPEILNLYKDYNVTFPDWKYGMSKDKNAREVLIVNL